MTNEEAIEALRLMNLRSVHPFLSWEEMKEVRDTAISVLQKQTKHEEAIKSLLSAKEELIAEQANAIEFVNLYKFEGSTTLERKAFSTFGAIMQTDSAILNILDELGEDEEK